MPPLLRLNLALIYSSIISAMFGIVKFPPAFLIFSDLYIYYIPFLTTLINNDFGPFPHFVSPHVCLWPLTNLSRPVSPVFLHIRPCARLIRPEIAFFGQVSPSLILTFRPTLTFFDVLEEKFSSIEQASVVKCTCVRLKEVFPDLTASLPYKLVLAEKRE